MESKHAPRGAAVSAAGCHIEELSAACQLTGEVVSDRTVHLSLLSASCHLITLCLFSFCCHLACLGLGFGETSPPFLAVLCVLLQPLMQVFIFHVPFILPVSNISKQCMPGTDVTACRTLPREAVSGGPLLSPSGCAHRGPASQKHSQPVQSDPGKHGASTAAAPPGCWLLSSSAYSRRR